MPPFIQSLLVSRWNTLFIQYIHKCHVPVCLVCSWTSASPFRTASSHSHRLVQWRAYTFSRSNSRYAIHMLMYANDMLFAHTILGEKQPKPNGETSARKKYVNAQKRMICLVLVSGVMCVCLLEWSSFPQHNARCLSSAALSLRYCYR